MQILSETTFSHAVINGLCATCGIKPPRLATSLRALLVNKAGENEHAECDGSSVQAPHSLGGFVGLEILEAPRRELIPQCQRSPSGVSIVSCAGAGVFAVCSIRSERWFSSAPFRPVDDALRARWVVLVSSAHDASCRASFAATSPFARALDRGRHLPSRRSRPAISRHISSRRPSSLTFGDDFLTMTGQPVEFTGELPIIRSPHVIS